MDKTSKRKTNMQAPLDSRLLTALQQTLEDEILQYESVVLRLNTKQEILVCGKPKLLAQIDQELLTLNHRAQQLEKQRRNLMQQLGYPDCTLEQLIQHMPPEVATQFNRIRDRLLRAIHDVSRLNRDTRDLLQLSLQWIHETVEVIASALSPEGASYNAQGNKAKRKGSDDRMAPIQSTINHSA